MEEESDNKINFLDITISKQEGNISFNIYRKPATTDTIIPSDSCHPPGTQICSIKVFNKQTTNIHFE
jgi:hypothetical protein